MRNKISFGFVGKKGAAKIEYLELLKNKRKIMIPKL